MCDDFTRESIGGNVARSITADDVVEILDRALLVRGAPGFIRCDNGPAFISAAIRDWCSFRDIETTYIAPGSPWQNPWAESFNSRARDELFAREILIQSARRASSTASGASSTITIGRTAPWAPWHQPSFALPVGPPPSRNPRRRWTS